MSQSAVQEVQLARQMLQAGRAAEAEQACRRALAAEAGCVDAAYLLGLLLLQRGETPAAIEWLEQAAASTAMTSVPEAHANLGHALRRVGRIDEASRALERALTLRPDYPIALNNLGMVRRAQGRLREAIELYQRALTLAPNLMPARMNLGNVLVDAGRAAEAVEVFRAVVRVAPANPDAIAALAGAEETAGDLAGAITSYESAIRARPDHVTSLVNLSQLIKRCGRVDDALALLRRAAAATESAGSGSAGSGSAGSGSAGLGPGGVEAARSVAADVREKLGRALWDAGRYDEGLREFERSIALSATPQTLVNFATLVPPIYASGTDVTRWRERLKREVGTLVARGVKIDVTDTVARAPFYVAYAGLDDREVMRQIASLHVPPAEAAESPTRSRLTTVTRVRVGFVSAFFKDHTVGLWTQGIIEKLPRERFEVIAFSIGRHDDAVARFVRSRADEFVELPDRLPAARRAIAERSLDVLVYADIGMEGFGYSLAFSRLAPVQCAMWGHPCTSGIGTIDYFLSSALAETEDAQANYVERLVRLANLPLYYHRPPPATPRDRAYFGLPAEAHVYGCLHSTFKLHPAFDEALGELLRRDPRGIVIVPKTGSANWDAMVLERFGRSYPDAVDRLRFIDRVSREDFRALNLVCDATLAPFPFGAGDTSLIAFAEGVPVVTMPTLDLRGRFTHAMYRAMGVMECVAATAGEYVEICLRLANDLKWRESVRGRILANGHVLFENEAGVSELAGWLEEVGRKLSHRWGTDEHG